jgi:ABC-type nickel/cobalt efflux system permease component RcnA
MKMSALGQKQTLVCVMCASRGFLLTACIVFVIAMIDASTLVMGLGTAITVAAIATLAIGARGLAGRLAEAKPGVGMLLVRGLEIAAALVIVLFGAALLTGYMVSERLMGV